MTEGADTVGREASRTGGGSAANEAMAAAETVHFRLTALERLLVSAPPVAQPLLCCLALRAALHPALSPFRDDPLLLLGGRFVSVDAQLSGLAAYAQERGIAGDVAVLLPHADRIAAFGDTIYSPAARPPAIGEVPGAIYLPHGQRAEVCRVLATTVPGTGAGAAWPTPVSLRPVAPDIEHAARVALGVALNVLEEQGALPETLRPQPLYFDICAPDLSDTVMMGIRGASLGLPLALAFLSVLIGRPVGAGFGATGALLDHNAEVGRGQSSDSIGEVGWVRAKADALQAEMPGARLLAPAPNGAPPESDARAAANAGVLLVASVTEAAQQCGLLPGTVALSEPLPLLVDEAAAPSQNGSVTPHRRRRRSVVVLTDASSADEGENSASDTICRIVRRVLSRRGGQVFIGQEAHDGIGGAHQGIGASFSDPVAACTAALDIQQALRCHLWPEDQAVPGIRVGIHDAGAGEAARLMEAGSPGQVLVSADITEQVRDRAPVSWRWKSLGLLRLRDLQPPRSLFQVSREPLPASFPPPRSLDSRRHNLPLFFDPFLGREVEIAAISRLLSDSAIRLVTLTGMRGVGKTRLALETAAHNIDSFPGGVWHISLIDEAEQGVEGVALAVLWALRKTVGSALPPLDQAVNALGDSRTLLVFDMGEEPLAGAAVFLEQIFSRCPRVSCLAASRGRLGIAGETPYSVLPLLPGAAEALFQERVRALLPDFELTEADKPLVTALCERLGGLPLAVELAAAQSRLNTLPRLLKQLQDAPASGDAVVSAPQATLALTDTLNKTYALLSEQERRLLARLSVFAGGAGFTAEAASLALVEEAFSSSGTGSAQVSASASAIDLLTILCERALIQQKRGAGDRMRYHMHGAIQDFARSHLRRNGEEESARRAHASYCLQIAQNTDRETRRELSDLSAVYSLLDDEMPNLRLAWSYLYDHDPDKIPAFVVYLAGYLRRRLGQVKEWQTWTRVALNLLERGTKQAAPPQFRGILYRYRALTFLDAGDAETALSFLQNAFAQAEKIGNRLSLAEAWHLRGIIMSRTGQHQEAMHAYQQARALFHEAGTPQDEVRCLNNLSSEALRQKDTAASEQYSREAYQLARQGEDTGGRAYAANNLGSIAEQRGELASARQYFSEFLELSRRYRDIPNVAIGLLNLGDILEREGSHDRALPVLALAEQMLQKIGSIYVREATSYLERGAASFDQEKLHKIRLEMERRSLEELLQMKPEAATLSLTLTPAPLEPGSDTAIKTRIDADSAMGMLY